MKITIICAIVSALLLFSCTKEIKLKTVFEDGFNRAGLGDNYTVQGGDWTISDGHVASTKAENRNLVLTGFALPQNGVIELTMWSESDGVDVKFNAWGDGLIHDHGDGYSFVLGGWSNRVSIIAKLHEHEKQRVENKAKLEKGKKYKVRVERLDNKISWFVDGALFLKYSDDDPLKTSDGYNRLSFGNWRSSVHFDDLKISEFIGE